MAAVQVSDVIVPEVFTPYAQQLTEEKARLIQSGVVTVSPVLNQLLDGGGATFNVPSWLDLDASDSTGSDNVSSDDVADIQAASFENSTPTDANLSSPAPEQPAIIDSACSGHPIIHDDLTAEERGNSNLSPGIWDEIDEVVLLHPAEHHRMDHDRCEFLLRVPHQRTGVDEGLRRKVGDTINKRASADVVD